MSKTPSRMEQLGNLLTAMIAVIVGGSSDLLGGDPPPEPSLIEKLAASYYVLPPDISTKFRPGAKHCGVLARISREIGLKRGCASNNFRGLSKSKRVGTAILAEIVKLEGDEFLSRVITRSTPHDSPFTAEERKQFGSGGQYGAVRSTVWTALHVHPATVGACIRGTLVSPRIVAALRVEMAAVDARSPKHAEGWPFPPQIRAQFGNGGRYRGLSKKVAAELGVCPSSVWNTSAGRTWNFRILTAIRDGMARIDAEIEAKKGRAS